jgi:hypothetical protein
MYGSKTCFLDFLEGPDWGWGWAYQVVSLNFNLKKVSNSSKICFSEILDVMGEKFTNWTELYLQKSYLTQLEGIRTFVSTC